MTIKKDITLGDIVQAIVLATVVIGCYANFKSDLAVHGSQIAELKERQDRMEQTCSKAEENSAKALAILEHNKL